MAQTSVPQESLATTTMTNDKIHKPPLTFELMIKNIKTFLKYPVCPLSANSFGKKYINSVRCSLYLRENWIFSKSLTSFCHQFKYQMWFLYFTIFLKKIFRLCWVLTRLFLCAVVTTFLYEISSRGLLIGFHTILIEFNFIQIFASNQTTYTTLS